MSSLVIPELPVLPLTHEESFTFEDFAQTNTYIYSYFTIALTPTSQAKFCLTVTPKYDSQNNNLKDDILVYLQCTNKDVKKLPINLEISICDRQDKKCYIKVYDWIFTDTSGHFVAKLISRKDVVDRSQGFLVNGTFTICLKVDVLDKLPSIYQNPIELPSALLPTTTSTAPPNIISSDFQILLESNDLTDVKLLIGSASSDQNGSQKEFSAHKAILSARSKVFAKMFKHPNTKESIENRVAIPDFDPDVFEQFLFFIYTGKVNKLDRFAVQLFEVADKYNVDSLKTECEHYLGAALTTESLVNSLLLADMYREEDLKRKCLDYFTKNGKDVMATEGWVKISTKPDLLVELLKNALEQTQIS